MRKRPVQKERRVLVTALGGELGQAIAKSLRLGSRPYHVVGTDVMANGIGSLFAQEFYKVPYAQDSSYVSEMARLCTERNIDCLIPANESELEVLNEAFPDRVLPNGARLICLAKDVHDVLKDKLLCMHSLAGRVPLVKYADGRDANAVAGLVARGFPLIVKGRQASGSKGLALVQNPRQLKAALRRAKAPLVQAYIDDSEGEFSVGVFACGDFLEAVCFRRKLGDGIFSSTWSASVEADQAVLDYSLRIARLIGCEGSFNIQVRKNQSGVWLLEINPRFSSLAAARAACGFRDVEWSIAAALGEFDASKRPLIKPMRFHRFISELVDFGTGYQTLDQWAPQAAGYPPHPPPS
jgi:carbamoyl-phosphate synthase large subunit